MRGRNLGHHQLAVEAHHGVEGVATDRTGGQARAQGGVADEARLGPGEAGEGCGHGAAGVAQRQGGRTGPEDGALLIGQMPVQRRVDQGG